jgi:hypothetical protein
LPDFYETQILLILFILSPPSGFTLLPRDRDSMHVTRHPLVTVIGKAFYDIDHSGKDPGRNRRNYDSSLAVWEIHPVMRLIQSVGPV